MATSALTLNTHESCEDRFEQIIGSSPALEAVLEKVERVAPTGVTVLIEGETGTGKELIARSVHNLSPRYRGPFVQVNCAAIPLNLLESELFGHEKGAFTGAIAQRIGRFEKADGGTLFLDEVGDIPPALQPKLLRVLQEREFERLGSGTTRSADVRIVAATNRSLAKMVAQRHFRDDLYYRLNVFPIYIPALRERREDIPLLVRHYVAKYSASMRRSINAMAPEAMDVLAGYDWPGNIRELQNVVERAVVMCEGDTLTMDEMCLPREATPSGAVREGLGRLDVVQERRMIETALTDSGGRVFGPRGAAVKLGVPRSTLESRIRSLNINKHQFKSV